jgi:hypothetical protein
VEGIVDYAAVMRKMAELILAIATHLLAQTLKAATDKQPADDS